MGLEGIVLSEVSQRERQMLHNITYMWNLQKLNSQKQRVEWWLTGAGVWGKWGDAGQRVQAFSCKMNKF